MSEPLTSIQGGGRVLTAKHTGRWAYPNSYAYSGGGRVRTAKKHTGEVGVS